MVGREWCRTMAVYNRWTNEGLYEACAAIPDDIRRKDCGVFYKSIHGTLNHLLHGDQMWMARFEDQPVGAHPFGVDLFADFDELRQARGAMDARIAVWTDGVSEDWLAGPFTFTSRAFDQTFHMPASAAVTHMFNHQTHHRGQLSALIAQLGFEAPPSDLVLLPDFMSDTQGDK